MEGTQGTTETEFVKGTGTRRYLLIVGAVLVACAVGVIAAMVGETDDAPGLVLIGITIITLAVVFGVKAAMGRGGAR